MTRIGTMLLVAGGLGACSFVLALETDGDEPPHKPHAELGLPMTAEHLGELILDVDEEASLEGSTWLFRIADLDAIVVYDVAADRMRIVIPVGPTDMMEKDELLRIMQANFDSALDARYAIARGMLWGVFIHPLSPLTDEEFLVGLAQTVNVVKSYGTSYSSGLFIYGNGDSVEIEQQRLIDELRKKDTT